MAAKQNTMGNEGKNLISSPTGNDFTFLLIVTVFPSARITSAVLNGPLKLPWYTKILVPFSAQAATEDIPLTSLEESLLSLEKLDRTSPELWPEQSKPKSLFLFE